MPPILRSTLLFFAGAALCVAQDLGVSDQLRRVYLSETVRRGLPLTADGPSSGGVPFWPALDRLRAEAVSLDPGPETDLTDAWIALQEGDRAGARATLAGRWPRPALVRTAPRLWAEALYASWEPGADPQAWIDSWLAYEEKAYAPRVLVRGLEVLEGADPSAVAPLLAQARKLYPEDRRFLPLAVRHPEVVSVAAGLVARDRGASGGWSDGALTALLRRQPTVAPTLVKAGYPSARIDGLLSRDYGDWLNRDKAPLDGLWTWDGDRDGVAESRIVFAGGTPVTWTRTSAGGGVWTLAFSSGLPDSVTEYRSGSSWTLSYGVYPVAQALSYRWGNHTLVYRFAPLEVEAPLWPEARFRAEPSRLPSVLAELWLPLDARLLASRAASIESWDAGVRVQNVLLYDGQVWLQTDDSDRDGRDDTWSFFRSGALASVYRDGEGQGQATLREIYRKGELAQVQSRHSQVSRPEFVLFPAEGVQLWDPQARSRPLDRVFQWADQGRMDALVFTGDSLPWETMPRWEPRP